jgi:ribosomal protein S27E
VFVQSSWWGSYPYAGAAVTLSVLNGDTGSSPPLTGYSGLAFVSDGLGSVKYMLYLDPAVFISGNKYAVNATATRILKTDYDWVWFNVKVVPQSIAVRVVFDRADYYSGDSGTLTVSAQPPEGHSQPNAYKYTMYPPTGNYVFDISSGSQPTFSFTIPLNYDQDGIYFLVEASNAEGDYGSTTASKYITYGVMIVNADPDFYNPGDTVTFGPELKSGAITSPGPLTFFYQITAGMSIVKQGTSSASGNAGDYTTSIPFTVPAVAAQSYEINVMANQNGHLINGYATVNLKQGFIMSIKFDKDSYSAGDTMKVSYTITPIAPNTPSPTVYYFNYGIIGLPFESWSGTSASGEFTYKVTDNANEGDNIFQVGESSTGAQAQEVVLIGPEKGTIGGIAIFEWFLLALIVILFLLMLAFRFRGAPSGGAAPKPKEEKAAPPPPPGPSASPMIVNCKACGAPIEITTSKRPIEVMCPSCGETAMVE